MMRWSRFFIPTLKETPQDAEIASHQLMLRAGIIRRLGSGLYSYLPLGLRSLRKVADIVRDEMDRAGAQELLMPAVQPADLWRRSGRYEAMTDVMFRLRDKNDRDMVLGPTHEEVITDIVAREIHSYRQLPVNFYQVQTKFRDEIRPRFGLMRAREFIMKDAYSFDIDDDAAVRSYEGMYAAYSRIFSRCGLATTAVEADSGAIGGSHSHEFMVLAEAGRGRHRGLRFLRLRRQPRTGRSPHPAARRSRGRRRPANWWTRPTCPASRRSPPSLTIRSTAASRR